MKNGKSNRGFHLSLSGLLICIVFLFLLQIILSCDPEVVSVDNLIVVYDGNGATSGSPPIDDLQYLPGDDIIVKENSGSLLKDGASFDGWNTTTEGNGTSYLPGDSFKIGDNDIKLYAKWIPIPQNTDQTVETLGINFSTVDLIDPASLGLQLKGQKWLLEPNETMTVKASTAIIVDSFQWYLDGGKNEANVNEFVINATSLNPGQHTVAVVARKDETYSSASYIFNIAGSTISLGLEDGILPSGAYSYNYSATNTYISNPSEEELWRVVSSESHNGGKSLRAGTIDDGETSYLRIPIEISEGQILAKVSFWYKVSNEEGFDLLRFNTLLKTESDTYIWNRLAQFSGEKDWSQYSTYLNYSWLDSLSIVFIYAKTAYFEEGQDTAWIDDIQITYIAE